MYPSFCEDQVVLQALENCDAKSSSDHADAVNGAWHQCDVGVAYDGQIMVGDGNNESND